MGPKLVCTTQGRHGAIAISKEDVFVSDGFPVECVDTTGAGDVFHGAFIVGLLKGWPLPEILKLSNAAAALKCRFLGGRKGIPSLQEALQFLAERVNMQDSTT
jgi:sugar/nucleoside kinase (ribokinase family)